MGAVLSVLLSEIVSDPGVLLELLVGQFALGNPRMGRLVSEGEGEQSRGASLAVERGESMAQAGRQVVGRGSVAADWRQRDCAARGGLAVAQAETLQRTRRDESAGTGSAAAPESWTEAEDWPGRQSSCAQVDWRCTGSQCSARPASDCELHQTQTSTRRRPNERRAAQRSAEARLKESKRGIRRPPLEHQEPMSSERSDGARAAAGVSDTGPIGPAADGRQPLASAPECTGRGRCTSSLDGAQTMVRQDLALGCSSRAAASRLAAGSAPAAPQARCPGLAAGPARAPPATHGRPSSAADCSTRTSQLDASPPAADAATAPAGPSGQLERPDHSNARQQPSSSHYYCSLANHSTNNTQQPGPRSNHKTNRQPSQQQMGETQSCRPSIVCGTPTLSAHDHTNSSDDRVNENSKHHKTLHLPNSSKDHPTTTTTTITNHQTAISIITSQSSTSNRQSKSSKICPQKQLTHKQINQPLDTNSSNSQNQQQKNQHQMPPLIGAQLVANEKAKERTNAKAHQHGHHQISKKHNQPAGAFPRPIMASGHRLFYNSNLSSSQSPNPPNKAARLESSIGHLASGKNQQPAKFSAKSASLDLAPLEPDEMFDSKPPERKWLNLDRRQDHTTNPHDHHYCKENFISDNGERFNDSRMGVNESTFTIMSYNILSDLYVNKDRFKSSPKYSLVWLYRRESILRELLQLDCDIVALQELELQEFDDYFKPRLETLGEYECLFEPKSRARRMDRERSRRVDGCAIFFKRNKFRLVERHLLEFSRIAMANAHGSEAMLNRVMNKDNIGLVAILEIKQANDCNSIATKQMSQTTTSSSPSISYTNIPISTSSENNKTSTPMPTNKAQRILVCNTHIYWDPEFCDVKLIQTIMLMNELSCIARHHTAYALIEQNVQKQQCNNSNSKKTHIRINNDKNNNNNDDDDDSPLPLGDLHADSEPKIEINNEKISLNILAQLEQLEQENYLDYYYRSNHLTNNDNNYLTTTYENNNNNNSNNNDNNRFTGAPVKRHQSLLPLILLGDFNSIPQSGVFDYLTRGQITSQHEDFKHFRYTSCSNALAISNYYNSMNSYHESLVRASSSSPSSSLLSTSSLSSSSSPPSSTSSYSSSSSSSSSAAESSSQGASSSSFSDNTNGGGGGMPSSGDIWQTIKRANNNLANVGHQLPSMFYLRRQSSPPATSWSSRRTAMATSSPNDSAVCSAPASPSSLSCSSTSTSSSTSLSKRNNDGSLISDMNSHQHEFFSSHHSMAVANIINGGPEQLVVGKELFYSHPFELASAYMPHQMPYTNYTDNFKAMIDYIYYSQDSFQLVGLLDKPDYNWLKRNKIEGLPQPNYPSDHLPIVARLRLMSSSLGSQPEPRHQYAGFSLDKCSLQREHQQAHSDTLLAVSNAGHQQSPYQPFEEEEHCFQASSMARCRDTGSLGMMVATRSALGELNGSPNSAHSSQAGRSRNSSTSFSSDCSSGTNSMMSRSSAPLIAFKKCAPGCGQAKHRHQPARSREGQRRARHQHQQQQQQQQQHHHSSQTATSAAASQARSADSWGAHNGQQQPQGRRASGQSNKRAGGGARQHAAAQTRRQSYDEQHQARRLHIMRGPSIMEGQRQQQQLQQQQSQTSAKLKGSRPDVQSGVGGGGEPVTALDERVSPPSGSSSYENCNVRQMKKLGSLRRNSSAATLEQSGANFAGKRRLSSGVAPAWQPIKQQSSVWS